MNTLVTENNLNDPRDNKNIERWTSFREGIVFKEFINNWQKDEYGVNDELVKKVSDEFAAILSKCVN